MPPRARPLVTRLELPTTTTETQIPGPSRSKPQPPIPDSPTPLTTPDLLTATTPISPNTLYKEYRATTPPSFHMATTNIFTTPPTLEDVNAAIDDVKVSNSIASLDTLARIDNAAKSTGHPLHTKSDAARSAVYLAFAFLCVDLGCSERTNYPGTKDGVKFALVAGEIKAQCTIRQFCAYYAPVVFDGLVRRGRAPANWARKGYTEDTKYAAFDFFHGVTHPNSLQPANGLIRQPTNAELAIQQTNAAVHIVRARRQAASTNVELTGGTYQDNSGVKLLPAPSTHS